MRTRTVILTAVVLTALTSCSTGSADSKSAAEPDGATTTASAVTATAEPTDTAVAPTDAFIHADYKVGQEAWNRGAAVTIKKVRESATITLNGATKQAGADGKYVTLETVVLNDSKASMDLTCSLPIISALIDDQDRRFDTIDDLYDIPGNPECNEALQPGFRDKMKFVYLVPRDAKVVLWEFREYDLEASLVPTTVDLT